MKRRCDEVFGLALLALDMMKGDGMKRRCCFHPNLCC